MSLATRITDNTSGICDFGEKKSCPQTEADNILQDQILFLLMI